MITMRPSCFPTVIGIHNYIPTYIRYQCVRFVAQGLAFAWLAQHLAGNSIFNNNNDADLTMKLYANVFLYLKSLPPVLLFSVAENLPVEGIFCYKHTQTEEFPFVTRANHNRGVTSHRLGVTWKANCPLSSAFPLLAGRTHPSGKQKPVQLLRPNWHSALYLTSCVLQTWSASSSDGTWQVTMELETWNVLFT